MSALAVQRRFDSEALRPLVPVAAVLRHFAIEAVKEKGRTRCPVHGGQNCSALSYDPTRWHCFACGAGGDAYDLVMALRGCGFPESLAVIAELAGLSVDCLPRIDRGEVARRETIARRRAALRRWRVERLRQFLNLVGDLGRDADRLGAYYAEINRRDDPDRWRLLGAIHWDLTRAEYLAALLSTTDEAKWAELWLAERRGDLVTPGDLR